MSSQQIRYGSKSALDVQPFNEGNLYFVQDGNKTDLYADLKGERTRVTDIVFNNIFDKKPEKKQIRLQSKIITPGKQRFVASADTGYDGLLWVEVKPIPDNYKKVSEIKEQLTKELTEQLTKELTEKITKDLTNKITKKIEEENVNSFDDSVIIDTKIFSTWMDNT